MKLFRTRNIKVLSTLMLVACVGASFFMTSCKPKDEIDKKAVAQLGFYETYKYNYIAPNIIKLCEAAGDSTLLKNKVTINGESPIVCHAQKNDTAAINAIIEKYGKDILPADLKLMWTQKPENGFFQLIALKTNVAGEPAMTGESITKANVTRNKQNGFVLYSAISITLDNEGTIQFSRLTAENVGRPIAIVYKDKVLSYPMVQCQIEGGRVEITGNFSEQELNALVDEFYNKK